MKLRLVDSNLGLRNSTTRIPFRYGTACLTRCPQAVLEASIELSSGVHRGYSGDCLPPSWFDKDPTKDFARQIRDMLSVIQFAQLRFHEHLKTAAAFFPAWHQVHAEVHAWANQNAFTPLLASFGVSLVERAIIDAACRSNQSSFAKLVRANALGIDAQLVHPSLSGLNPVDWLPVEPLRTVFVRHTIGLGDPLTAADIPAGDRLNDGFPQALEEYVATNGVRYFKIKVSNNLDRDLERLRAVANIVERYHGRRYGCTLDGNEQFKRPEEFDDLIAAIVDDPKLQSLWENVVVIEQPLDRKIALDPAQTLGIRDLAAHKPVIIDESDGELHSYAQAIELGYRGVSSKNCKGAIKSILNAGLTWLRNDRALTGRFVMTGEDLCSVGIIPTQADLCLAATLGLGHVERNGHHYHPGLSYLPTEQQELALQAHSDFYTRQHGRIVPLVVDGRFDIGSLQCAGFGFAVLPDMRTYQPAAQWTFDSLGLT